jgi:hypothetical protein
LCQIGIGKYFIVMESGFLKCNYFKSKRKELTLKLILLIIKFYLVGRIIGRQRGGFRINSEVMWNTRKLRFVVPAKHRLLIFQFICTIYKRVTEGKYDFPRFQISYNRD